MMISRLKTAFLLMICCAFMYSSASFALPYRSLLSQQTNVAEFIDKMVAEHHFDKAALNKLFNQIHIRPRVIQHINKPHEAKPWYFYKKLFVTEDRIRLGKEFWQQHAKALARAEKEYGVPAEIIVAILGVETKYGKHQGDYRVIDSLATLSFEHQARASFFKKELGQFLLLCRELKLDPTTVRGSYAGAIGQSQFMPSSYRYYAVDFTGNGNRDLRNDPIDAIGSIANYLQKNGWAAGQQIAFKAQVKKEADYKQFLRKNAKPTFSIAQLSKNGIQINSKLNPSTLASVINLRGQTAPEYWLGLQNFYVITRYNTSKLYAMAVLELSQKIKQEHQLASQKKNQSNS